LNNGTPEILTNARCDKSLLRRDAIGEEIGVGNAAVKRLGTWKGDRNPRPSFVWRWVEDEVFDKVTDWVYKRDAEVKALTEGDGEGGDVIPVFGKNPILTAVRARIFNARSAPKLPEIPAFRDIYARGTHPRRGELVMIVGRPGSQKSGFALYWTATMNLPTLYFSADMNGFQYSSRLAGIMGGYTTEQCERMMRGSRTEQEQLLRSVEGLNMISSFETPIRWESISYQLEAYVELHNAYPEVMVF